MNAAVRCGAVSETKRRQQVLRTQYLQMCLVDRQTHWYILLFFPSTSAFLYVSIHTYIHICVCIYVCMYYYVFVSLNYPCLTRNCCKVECHLCIYVCMCLYVCVYMYVCVCATVTAFEFQCLRQTLSHSLLLPDFDLNNIITTLVKIYNNFIEIVKKEKENKQ